MKIVQDSDDDYLILDNEERMIRLLHDGRFWIFFPSLDKLLDCIDKSVKQFSNPKHRYTTGRIYSPKDLPINVILEFSSFENIINLKETHPELFI